MYPPLKKNCLEKFIAFFIITAAVTSTANAQNVTLLQNILESQRDMTGVDQIGSRPTAAANAGAAIEIETEPTQPPAVAEVNEPEVAETSEQVVAKSEPKIEVDRSEVFESKSIERNGQGTTAVTKKTAWYQDGLLPLGVVLAAIGLIGLMLKKWKGTAKINGGSVLSVLTTTHLSQKQSVALVQMGGKFVFVGVTPQSITPLRIIEDREEAATVKTKLRLGGIKQDMTSFENLVRDEGNKIADAMEPDASSDTTIAAGNHEVRNDISGLLDRLRTLRKDATPTSSIER